MIPRFYILSSSLSHSAQKPRNLILKKAYPAATIPVRQKNADTISTQQQKIFFFPRQKLRVEPNSYRSSIILFQQGHSSSQIRSAKGLIEESGKKKSNGERKKKNGKITSGKSTCFAWVMKGYNKTMARIKRIYQQRPSITRL